MASTTNEQAPTWDELRKKKIIQLPDKIKTSDGSILHRVTNSILITPKTKHLYPNFSYFGSLANRGDSCYSYFRPVESKGGQEEPTPCTWGSDMDEIYDEEHISNPRGILPTIHELKALRYNFDVKLYGHYVCLDTEEDEHNPPKIRFEDQGLNVVGGLRVKPKLPPGWHMTLNKDKNKYFYWDETRKSQWGHPWPTMIKDIQSSISVFKDITDNYTKSIHSNMDLNGEDFYELMGIIKK